MGYVTINCIANQRDQLRAEVDTANAACSLAITEAKILRERVEALKSTKIAMAEVMLKQGAELGQANADCVSLRSEVDRLKAALKAPYVGEKWSETMASLDHPLMNETNTKHQP